MAAIGKVSLRGIVHDDFHYTFLVKTGGGNDAVAADAGVKAVSLDTAAANQVKLAVDGDKILGRLEIFEDREVEGIVVGTVALKGGMKFMINPNVSVSSPDERPAVGDNIVGDVSGGSVAGYVRKATTAEKEAGKDNWLVVEADDAHTYVIAINV